MGLQDLTPEQWNTRLELRFKHLQECTQVMDSGIAFEKSTDDLLNDIRSGAKPLSAEMRRFLEAAAAFEHEFGGVVTQAAHAEAFPEVNPRFHDYAETLKNIGAAFGELWTGTKPLLLQSCTSDQERLHDLEEGIEESEGAKVLAVTILDAALLQTGASETAIEILARQGWTPGNRPSGISIPLEEAIFTYVPRPALIHAILFCDYKTWKAPAAYIDVERSVQDTCRHDVGDRHLTTNPEQLRDFEEILAIEAVDPFNLYVVRTLERTLVEWKKIKEGEKGREEK